MRARRRTRREAAAWLERVMRDPRIPLAALDRLAAWAGAPAAGSLGAIARAVVTRRAR